MICNNCGLILDQGKTRCSCGWSADGKSELRDRPPPIEDVLTRVVAQFMARHTLPSWMPQTPYDVARWWIHMQEPPKLPADRPHQVSVVGDDGQRWICPYHQRISHTLRVFLELPEHDQRIIVAAREDGVFWRGDEMYFFMLVIAETQKMRKMGVTSYREECLAKMKSSRFLAPATTRV